MKLKLFAKKETLVASPPAEMVVPAVTAPASDATGVVSVVSGRERSDSVQSAPEISVQPSPHPTVGVPASGVGPTTAEIPQGPYKYKKPIRQRGSVFGWSTVIFICMCSFGYYKYDEYKKRPPPPPPVKPKVALREAPTHANPLTAFKQVKNIITTAGDKHKAAYDEVAAMDKLTAGETKEVSPKTSRGPVVVSSAVATSAATVSVVGAVTDVTTPTVSREVTNIVKAVAAVDVQPSLAFKTWATKIKIGGMRQGDRPRVLIERTAYEVGDMVDHRLGIKFEGYNIETRMLRFKERSGALVEVLY